jgi:hypothetical protein
MIYDILIALALVGSLTVACYLLLTNRTFMDWLERKVR